MNSHDYTYSLLYAQRRAELRAEAEQDWLARLALADRTPWWRRLRALDAARSRHHHPVAHRVA